MYHSLFTKPFSSNRCSLFLQRHFLPITVPYFDKAIFFQSLHPILTRQLSSNPCTLFWQCHFLPIAASYFLKSNFLLHNGCSLFWQCHFLPIAVPCFDKAIFFQSLHPTVTVLQGHHCGVEAAAVSICSAGIHLQVNLHTYMASACQNMSASRYPPAWVWKVSHLHLALSDNNCLQILSCLLAN